MSTFTTRRRLYYFRVFSILRRRRIGVCAIIIIVASFFSIIISFYVPQPNAGSEKSELSHADIILSKSGVDNTTNIETHVEFPQKTNGVRELLKEDRGSLVSRNFAPSDLPQIDYWQPVGDGPLPQTYVFSSYLDRRGYAPRIKVMAISTHSERQPIQFWLHIFYSTLDSNGHDTDEAVASFEANPETIPEGHGKRFSSIIISCKLPAGTRHSPPLWISVSLSEHPSSLQNKLRLHNRDDKEVPSHDYSVCVTPLNRNYGDFSDQFIELLEFIEITSMFGASKLTFYNVSTGHTVSHLFQHYQDAGIVDVIDWKLPVHVEQNDYNEIHYFGQVIALNDCLYRNMFRSRYIAFIDPDELIVPQAFLDWGSMIRNLSARTNDDIGAFIFPNVFFRKEWASDAGAGRLPQFKGHTPRTLTYTKREIKVWAHRNRSKYIVIPRKIKTVGIHFVFSFVGPSAKEFRVSARDGMLYHYRNWEDYAETTAFIVNRRMYNFKDEIIRRISLTAES